MTITTEPTSLEQHLINCKRFELIEINDKSKSYFCLSDCIKGMDLLPAEFVDVVVTSPPYNIGIKYNGYNDKISRDEYLCWVREWGMEIKRVLSEEGSFFLNIGAKPSDQEVPFRVLEILTHSDMFRLQNTIHWIKSVAISKRDVGNYPGLTRDIAVGHYKPINSDRFINDCHEFIFHFTKTGDVPLDRTAIGVPYQDKTNIKRWKRAGNGLHCRGNTWFLPYKTIQNRKSDRPHPATFPPKLPEMCIRLHGVSKTKLVLDPFMGLANTAIACRKLSVSCIGFETDEIYWKESIERFKSAKI